YPARDCLRVLGSVLVDEASISGNVGQQNPARAAAERVSHRAELGAPAIDRAEVAREDLGHPPRRLTVAAEAREIELMQQRRIERDELLALERVQNMAGRAREVERLELFGDRVETPERPTVIILVMALDELYREIRERPGTAMDLLQRIAHVILQVRTTKYV